MKKCLLIGLMSFFLSIDVTYADISVENSEKDNYNDGKYIACDYNKEFEEIENVPKQISETSNVTQIECGEETSYVLITGGALWGWGKNSSGELGDGTIIQRNTPVQLLDSISAVSGGAGHTIFLKSDGTVWTSGYNGNGQLGDGTYTNRSSPVQVSGLINVTAISAGYLHSIALKSDGTVWAWGINWAGDLGDGTTTERTTPVQVSGLSNVIAIAAGSLALKSDGTVWAWGRNSAGWVGDGTTTNRTTPVQVQGLSDVIAIDGRGWHRIALKSDGTVWAWGANQYGQIGDGSTTDRHTPTQVSGLTGISAIAAGGNYNFALKSDGTFWSWGHNKYGQLGDKTYTNSTIPVKVSVINGVTDFAAGSNHTIVLKSDGTIWTWGWNEYGQLGDGTTTDQMTPGQVSGITTPTGTITGTVTDAYTGNSISGVKVSTDTGGYSTTSDSSGNYILSDVTAGTYFLTASKSGYITSTSEVTVTAGETTTSNFALTPIAVPTVTPTPTDITAPKGSININGGASYTTSTTVTLTLSATDDTGVTGYYLSSTSSTPSASAAEWTGITSTTSYSANISYTLSSGGGSKTIYVWYRDATGNVSGAASGSIVLDTTAPTVNITSPTSSATYTATSSTISLGGSASDSTSGISSVTWSSTGGSGVASGTTSWTVSGISLSNGSNTITITAKDNAGNTATDTITVTYNAGSAPTATTGSVTNITSNSATLNGTVNPNGLSTTAWFEYGPSSGTYGNKTSTQTISGTSATSISIGVTGLSAEKTYYYRIAAKNDAGTTYGSEDTFKTSPASSSTTSQISAGGYHNLAIRSDGTVWGWGSNGYGELGDGNTTNRSTPVQVKNSDDSLFNEVISVGVSLNMDYYSGRHSLALKSDGTVWAWGSNYYGQLGAADTDVTDTYDISYSYYPIQVSGLTGVIAIACGEGFSVALKEDGTVWTWGYNGYGQLGDGTTTNRNTPVQVKSLSGIIAVACGRFHCLALRSDGTVWAWGYNYRGQLGNGASGDYWSGTTTPVKASGLTGVIAIAGGSSHSLALKSDGTVWAWGSNWNGQLGDGTTTDRYTPVQVNSISNVTAIAGGGDHSLALKSDGTVWAWGYNSAGQLGDNTTTNRWIPVQVNSISNVTVIDGGGYHSMAIISNCEVWTWGYNYYGQLGDGTLVNSSAPVQVENLTLCAVATQTPIPSPSPSPSPTSINTPRPIPTVTQTPIIRTGTIMGMVTDEAFQGIAGTTVSTDTGGYSATTDSAGIYIISDVVPGDYVLTASASGYSSASTVIAVVGEGLPLFVDFQLQKLSTPSTGIILGFVYDEDEDPLKGVTVHISGTNNSENTQTDEEGYYEFTELAAGNYTLTYEKEGYKTENRDVSLEDGETMYVDNVFMEEVQKGSIYGYVVDIRGDALEKVRLKLKGVRTRVTKIASSDREGFFEFEDLDPDTYRIAVSKRFYRKVNKIVELEEGEYKEIEIELRKTSRKRIMPIPLSEGLEIESGIVQ